MWEKVLIGIALFAALIVILLIIRFSNKRLL